VQHAARSSRHVVCERRSTTHAPRMTFRLPKSARHRTAALYTRGGHTVRESLPTPYFAYGEARGITKETCAGFISVLRTHDERSACGRYTSADLRRSRDVKGVRAETQARQRRSATSSLRRSAISRRYHIVAHGNITAISRAGRSHKVGIRWTLPAAAHTLREIRAR
jgi:hypothetical protein